MLKIRPYSESDEAAVAELWREVFPSSPSWNHPETDIQRKLFVQRELFLVAALGSEIVGTAMSGYDGHRGWVYYVAVSPRQRRQGIGTALMRGVEEGLARLGCPKLNLQVRASNHPVVAFYKRLGYEVEERVSMGKRLEVNVKRDIPDFKSMAAQEQARLGTEGALRLLKAGRAWDLAPALRSGGAVIFPHASIGVCGHQIAATVHACLDSGADRVLVIGVLHALTHELEEARVRVARGGDVTREPSWGIQGPGLKGREDWRAEFSLSNFLFLWGEEIKRRGIGGPELIVRYPYLAGGRPHILPGIKELQDMVGDATRDTVVVATADPFHHGIGYGDSPETALAPEEGGVDLARRRIEEGLALLQAGDYWGYNQHCVDAKSDARDAGQVLRYLLGPLQGRILDLVADDMTSAYDKPAPTWVAGALIELQPVRPSEQTSLF